MVRLFGSRATWRYDKSAPQAEERDAHRLEATRLQGELVIAMRARDDRMKVLAQDPEYVQLRDEAQRLHTARETAAGNALRHRVTVGRTNGMFFEVIAVGDNWQDAIDSAREQVAKAKA